MGSAQSKVALVTETYGQSSMVATQEHAWFGANQPLERPRDIAGRVNRALQMVHINDTAIDAFDGDSAKRLERALIRDGARDRLHEAADRTTAQDALREAIA